MNINGIDSYGIELKHDIHGEDKYAIYGYGVYPDSSILAGQFRKVFIEWCDDLEHAERRSETLNGFSKQTAECPSTHRDDAEALSELSGLPKFPPDWFDPSDAGERWDDDY